jgi:hypothetical protein
VGGHPDAASRSGLARPDINAKPRSILRADGQQDVTRRRRRRPPAFGEIGPVRTFSTILRGLLTDYRRVFSAA